MGVEGRLNRLQNILDGLVGTRGVGMNIKSVLLVVFLVIFGCGAPRVTTKSSWVVPPSVKKACMSVWVWEGEGKERGEADYCFTLHRDTTLRGDKIVKDLFTLMVRIINKTREQIPGLQALYVTDREGLRIGLFTPVHYANYVTGYRPGNSNLSPLITMALMGSPTIIDNSTQINHSFNENGIIDLGPSRAARLGSAIGQGLANKNLAKMMLLSRLLNNEANAQQEWEDTFNKANMEFLRLRPLRPHEIYAGKVWFTTTIDRFPITLHMEETEGAITRFVIPPELLEEIEDTKASKCSYLLQREVQIVQ